MLTRIGPLENFRQPPIDDKRFSERPEENVRRFQITMTDALAVRITDRVANVDKSSQQIAKHRLWVRKVSFDAMVLLDRLVQCFGIAACHQSHRVERLFVGVDTPVIDRQDARVL